jgi:hypothetical protein
MQMYVQDCRDEMLSGDGLTYLMDALCGSQGAAALPETDTHAQVLCCLLEALFRCGSAGKATAAASIISDLHLVVSHLTRHPDSAVRGWADKVAAMFE